MSGRLVFPLQRVGVDKDDCLAKKKGRRGEKSEGSFFFFFFLMPFFLLSPKAYQKDVENKSRTIAPELRAPQLTRSAAQQGTTT